METSTDTQGRTIVVGVDGSASSDRALLWAAAEAARTSSSLRIVHAWRVPVAVTSAMYAAPYIDPREMERGAEAIVAGAVQSVGDLLGDGAPRTEPVVAEGHPVEVLVDAAVGADLLVVGTRGRSELAGALLGSVSAGCAHHTPVPLAVIGADAPALDGGVVVVGYDGSAGGAVALRWAVQRAQDIGAKVHVIHAWSAVLTMPFGGMPDVSTVADVPDPGPAIEQAVADAVHDLGDLPPTSIEIGPLPAAGTLLREAVGATALVVGSHGHGGFTGMLLGSVSNHCLHHSPCPLIIVPTREV